MGSKIILPAIVFLSFFGIIVSGFFYFKNLQENLSNESGEIFALEQENAEPMEEQKQSEELVPFTVSGPGGCKSIQECSDFCANNPQECSSSFYSKDLTAENQIFSEQANISGSQENNAENFFKEENKPQQPIGYQPLEKQRNQEESQPVLNENFEDYKNSVKKETFLGSIIQAFTAFFKY